MKIGGLEFRGLVAVKTKRADKPKIPPKPPKAPKILEKSSRAPTWFPADAPAVPRTCISVRLATKCSFSFLGSY